MSVIGSNALAGASGQAGGAGYVIEKSLRFNSGDSAYLDRTPSSAGNRKTWTLSFWVKNLGQGTRNRFHFVYGSGNENTYLDCNVNATGSFQLSSWGNYFIDTTAKFRDPSAWYHFVVQFDTTNSTDADRRKLWVNGVEVATNGTAPTLNGDYGFNNNVKASIGSDLNSSGNAFNFTDCYLAEYHFIDGQALDHTSFGAFDDNGVWQAAEYTGTYGTNGFHLFDFANETGIGNDSSGNENDWTANNLIDDQITLPTWYTTTTLYTTTADVKANGTNRGQSAFTLSTEEFVYLIPGGGGTVGSVCHSSGSTYPSSFYTYVKDDDDSNWYYTGGFGTSETDDYVWDNTLTRDTFSYGAKKFSNKIDLYLIGDTRAGSPYQPDSNAKMSGSFPALINTDGATADADADVLRDSPINGDATADTGAGGQVSGNYCTMNPVHSSATLENGNLDVKPIVGHSNNYGTFGMSSGRWYWEVYRGAYSANNGAIGFHGLASANKKLGTTWAGPGSNTDQHTFYLNSGTSGILYNGQGGASHSFTSASTPTLPTGWISDAGYYMFCVDMDNQKAWMGKDGVWWGWNGSAYTTTGGDPANGTNPLFVLDANDTYFPFNGAYSTSAGSFTFVHNFGQRPFAYTAPSGFKALCTTNLPTPDVPDGSAYFDTKLYSGNGSTNAITGLEFSPDLVWLKSRTGTRNHCLFDTVRGVNKRLLANTTDEEYTVANSLTSFDNNGFTLGSNNEANNSGESLVAWTWDAGTSNTTVSADSLTSSLYNQDQVWSNFLTSSNGFVGSYTADQAFNEVLDTGGGSATNGAGGVMTFAPTSALSVSTMDIRVYSDTTITFPDSSTVAVNGQGADLGWISVSLPSSFTGFTGSNNITLHNTNGGLQYFDGLRINGKILVNSNISLSVPSIASTYRANPSAGFSIVSYTGNGTAGATVAHGLNTEPSLLIVKTREAAGANNWTIYHKSAGNTHGGYLSATTFADDVGFWNDTSPTSSVVTLGNYDVVNANTKDLIMYAFSPVADYSAFGSYEGNGLIDGPFIWTGFKPAFLLIKCIDTTQYWYMADSSRSPVNDGSTEGLWANTNSSEFTYDVDILSNGFKHKNQSANLNTAHTFIYAAFAENPFQANGGLAR